MSRGPAKTGPTTTAAAGVAGPKVDMNGSAGAAGGAADQKAAARAPAAGSAPVAAAANPAASVPAVDSKEAAATIAQLKGEEIRDQREFELFIEKVIMLLREAVTVEQVCDLLKTKQVRFSGGMTFFSALGSHIIDHSRRYICTNFVHQILIFLNKALQANSATHETIFSLLTEPSLYRNVACTFVLRGDDQVLRELSKLIKKLKEQKANADILLFTPPMQEQYLLDCLKVLTQLRRYHLLPLEKIIVLFKDIKKFFHDRPSSHDKRPFFELLTDLFREGIPAKDIYDLLRKHEEQLTKKLFYVYTNGLPKLYFLLYELHKKCIQEGDEETAGFINDDVIKLRVYLLKFVAAPHVIIQVIDALFDFLVHFCQKEIVPFSPKEKDLINSNLKDRLLDALSTHVRALDSDNAIRMLTNALNQNHPLGQLFHVSRNPFKKASKDNLGSTLWQIDQKLKRRKDSAAKLTEDEKQVDGKAAAPAANAAAGAAAAPTNSGNDVEARPAVAKPNGPALLATNTSAERAAAALRDTPSEGRGNRFINDTELTVLRNV